MKGLVIDHLGIAVRSLEEASEPYQLLGFPVEGEDELIPSQGVRVRALRAGDSLLELLEPVGPESPIARYLERRGPGLHHVAFRVQDLEAEIMRLAPDGVTFISPEPRPGRAGSRVVFLHPKWAGGVLIELVAH